MKRDLRSFVGGSSFTQNRLFQLVTWFIFQHTIFKSWFLPTWFRATLLRLWGGKIGERVKIRRGVRVHFPWNLEIGDDCWIGEEVWIISHEKVKIGSNVCISQRSLICSGSHDYRSASLASDHKQIEIKDGAWICLDSKVLPGITIGECSVVAAGEVVRKSIPDNSMLIAGEIRQIDSPKYS